MFLRSIFISFFMSFLAAISIVSCSTGKSQVWFDEKISFADYHQLVIEPVHNASGTPDAVRVTVDLTKHLKTKFESNRLPIVSNPRAGDKVLIVRTNIFVYLACDIDKFRGPAGSVGLGTGQSVPRTLVKSMITLRTQLIDKSSNHVVAQISTTKVVGACFTESGKYQWLLEVAAEEIAKEVAKIYGF